MGALSENMASIFRFLFSPPEFLRMEKIDPVAVNTPNPKEYAGDADAIEPLEQWRGILAGAEWPSESVNDMPCRECYRQLLDDYHKLQRKIDALQKDRDSWEKIWRQQADTSQKQTSAFHEMTNRAVRAEQKLLDMRLDKTRFASIAPRYPGEDTRRAPQAGDKHKCGKSEIKWVVFPRDGMEWVLVFDIVFQRPVEFPVTHCPHCGGLLPTRDKHEGNS